MVKPAWKHIEHWEAGNMSDNVHIRIEDHGKHGGYFVHIGIGSSARGAECFDSEITRLITALTEAKAKVATIKKEKASNDPV